MKMHLIIKGDGSIIPAMIVTGTVKTIAVTAAGEILSGYFHILPTEESEVENRSLEDVEANGFPSDDLARLQRAMTR